MWRCHCPLLPYHRQRLIQYARWCGLMLHAIDSKHTQTKTKTGSQKFHFNVKLENPYCIKINQNRTHAQASTKGLTCSKTLWKASKWLRYCVSSPFAFGLEKIQSNVFVCKRANSKHLFDLSQHQWCSTLMICHDLQTELIFFCSFVFSLLQTFYS